MYSTLPTLNNKKITAMFYVHLFLKAMYRKTTGKNKNWLCISRMCRICRCTLSSWKKLKLQKAVASNVEEAERTQRRGKPAETKHCDCDWDEFAEGEINWQRVKERAQTTARKLHFLKRLPWMSGVWCVHLNRIFTGHKLFFFFYWKQKRKIKIKNQTLLLSDRPNWAAKGHAFKTVFL